jgi:hypothetical protein
VNLLNGGGVVSFVSIKMLLHGMSTFWHVVGVRGGFVVVFMSITSALQSENGYLCNIGCQGPSCSTVAWEYTYLRCSGAQHRNSMSISRTTSIKITR